jgi:predicted esterase
MNRIVFALALAALATVFVIAAAAPEAHAEKFTDDRTGLEYLLEPPADWDTVTPVNLLICLHGAGDKAENFKATLEGREGLNARLFKYMRVYPQSPSAAFDPARTGDLVQLIETIIEQQKSKNVTVEHSVLMGFSAGGFMAGAVIARKPDLFDGAIICGATRTSALPKKGKLRERFQFWSIGTKDDVCPPSEIQKLRDDLVAGEYGAAQAKIDIVPDLIHEIDNASVIRGFDFVELGIESLKPMTADEKAAIDRLEDEAKTEDENRLRTAMRKALETPHREARDYFYDKFARFAKHKNARVSLVAIEGLGLVADARGAEVLLKLSIPPKDEDRHIAWATSLGQIADASAVKALGARLKKWDGEAGATQVKCAWALGEIGGLPAIDALIDALKLTERREDRAAATEAILAALRKIAAGAVADDVTKASDWEKWYLAEKKKARD